MTNPDKALIGIVADRSGSMQQCQEDMEGGLNTFVKEQAQQPGEAEITLAHFDHEYELLWPIQPIQDAPYYSLIPRGNTALLDAMGRFITEVGEQLAARKEEDKPGKVIICIVTDGKENASRDWKREDVRKLVENQRSQWQWEFVFLGAKMDAIKEAASVGIGHQSSMTFDTANADAVYASTSNYVSALRATGAASFDDEDRNAALSKKRSRKGKWAR